MAIQMRRGRRADFDPAKLLPGEWAVAVDTDTNNQIVWMCFSAGVVKRMGTYEDFRQQITEATDEIKQGYLEAFQEILEQTKQLAEEVVRNKELVITVQSTIVNAYLPEMRKYLEAASTNASKAETAAEEAAKSKEAAKKSEDEAESCWQQAGLRAEEALNSAISAESFCAMADEHAAVSDEFAIKSESYAHGGTHSRVGESTDNGLYYKEQAQSSAQTASTQAQAAASSAAAAAASQTTSAQKASQAGTSAATASTKATESANSAVLSQSYAIGGTDSRTGEDTDNSKYYYQQSKSIYDNFSQAGTVTGLKGNAESTYRTGNVNLTAENIGLGNVNNTADANKNVATANQVNGVYTGNGGQQPPSYVTSGKTRFNMMNAFKGFTNPAGGYMDVILMDNYNGGDVPYVTGIGVTKNNGNPRMFIANGEKGSTGNWAHQVEVITSSNISSQNIASSTKATQDGNGNIIADTYAKKSIYGDTTVSLGRKSGTTVGSNSVVLGGRFNTASEGNSSVLGGYGNTVSGSYSSVSGGGSNTVSGSYSSVSGGSSNTVSENDSSVLGGYGNTVSGSYSSVSGGSNNTVSGSYSSVSGGSNNTASGLYSSVIGGFKLSSENNASVAFGHNNAKMTTGGSTTNTTGTAFAIGNGTSETALSNAFSVMFSGIVKAKSTITGSTTADYAEFFEWLDGNPRDEDRVGRFVTLTGNKITIANSNSDYILGIVSGEPFVLGNGDCDTWNGMYMKDDFNRTIYEPAPKIELNEETGERVPVVDEGGNPVYEGTRPKLNPEYDPDQPYISRFDRKEWSPVGMLGVLSVIDDGSCQVDGFCCCSTDGIATACEKETEGACRVIERISENVVRAVLK